MQLGHVKFRNFHSRGSPVAPVSFAHYWVELLQVKLRAQIIEILHNKTQHPQSRSYLGLRFHDFWVGEHFSPKEWQRIEPLIRGTRYGPHLRCLRVEREAEGWESASLLMAGFEYQPRCDALLS